LKIHKLAKKLKSFKYILFSILIVSIGLAIYVAVQPNSFKVSRTRTINAPSAVIYDNVSDFKNWVSWSSWIEADPDIKITLPEHTKGIDGSYSWEDKDDVGTMKTIEAIPNTSMQQEMQFADFPKSDVSWDFKANANGSTEVTWTISGKDLPFGFKAFSTFMGGMEKQIGPHYERSLEKLDSIVVSSMKKFDIKVNGVTKHSGGFYLYNTTSCKMADFKTKMQDMLSQVGAYAMSNNITMAGKPFILYHKWDDENNTVMFSSCIPTSEKVMASDRNILTGQLEPFSAVKTTLTGNYSNLKTAWKKAMAYFPENGLEFAEQGPMLESYVTDPMSTPNPAHWVTEIFIAFK
jgi:effector-binding domain-containing protein